MICWIQPCLFETKTKLITFLMCDRLGVLPAASSTTESLLASTSFVDVDHSHATSFADNVLGNDVLEDVLADVPGGSVGYDAATAHPGDVSGMMNGTISFLWSFVFNMIISIYLSKYIRRVCPSQCTLKPL